MATNSNNCAMALTFSDCQLAKMLSYSITSQ